MLEAVFVCHLMSVKICLVEGWGWGSQSGATGTQRSKHHLLIKIYLVGEGVGVEGGGSQSGATGTKSNLFSVI